VIQRSWTNLRPVIGRARCGDVMKVNFSDITSVIVVGLLGWGSTQLYVMKSELAVVSYRVEENYKMIKPMWQDFLVRQANYDKSWTNVVPNIHTTGGTE